MQITLNHHSGEPIYRQIVHAVRLRITAGELSAGAKLPSIRALARDLQINTRTVVKAYEELEKAGLAVMRHGQGVFVTEPQNTLPARERRRALSDLVQRLLSEAAEIGAGPNEVLEIVEAATADRKAAS